MELKEEIIEVRGEVFTVKELTVRGLMPMLSKMADDPMEAQLDMMKVCIFDAAGEPVGAEIESFPGAVFMPLSAAVRRINDIGGAEDEGNES